MIIEELEKDLVKDQKLLAEFEEKGDHMGADIQKKVTALLERQLYELRLPTESEKEFLGERRGPDYY